MKFWPVVPDICRGQDNVPKKERRKRRKRIRIIRNGAKTISLPNIKYTLNSTGIQLYYCFCNSSVYVLYCYSVVMVEILTWVNRDFSNLPDSPVNGPFPNEKYSKIMQNSKNFHSCPLILILKWTIFPKWY